DWQLKARARIAAIGADLVAQSGPHARVGRYLDSEKKFFINSPIADLKFRRALNRALPLAAGSLASPVLQSQPQEVPARPPYLPTRPPSPRSMSVAISDAGGPSATMSPIRWWRCNVTISAKTATSSR